ncbi:MULTISPECIES: GGDEF domain-containing protein [Kordiimonas]|jgi:diguanylate cyclase (GGDEF)-like protein|uniref:diguanylate cyclase n=1 Tax=Kordiimonas lacus TaxID=637679 RepID=A0A1G6XZQ2_9PROT|nr:MULTISPECIES: GGDEF domain-containing protein [Kordiimonas]SDD83704.1 diguanylate cyclase (GGDEF) domain-containing protein [Kordiimonas lacus]
MHYRHALSSRTARRVIFRRTLQGMIMGSGAPLGWAVIQIFRGVDLQTDIPANLPLYLYMLFGTMLVFSAFGFYVGKQEGLMRQRSLRDSLTGLYNLRHFRDRLDAEVINARRHETPLSLIFFDLDHFKKVNDTYGHAAGDLVLVAVTESVASALRQNELFARIGGEEFAILLPQTSLDQAAQLAERLLDVIHDLSISIDDERKITTTMSLGVVMLKPDEDAKSISERADEAMYQAKRSGRDRAFTA